MRSVSPKTDLNEGKELKQVLVFSELGGQKYMWLVRKTTLARMALNCILSLTFSLGSKNEKQPSDPIELDLEAGNLNSIFTIFAKKSIHV